MTELDIRAGAAGNPLLRPFDLPFGLPPFAEITTAHFGPALDAGMAEQLAEIAAIVADPAPPTFGNTVVALERSGRLLDRASSVFHNLVSSVATDELQAVEAEYAARLAAHSDAIRLDRDLWRRLRTVIEAGDAPDAQAEQLLERYRLDFVLSGADLDEAGQQRLRGLNGRISELSTTFRQQLQAAMDAAAVWVADESDLAGLSAEQIAGAAAAAAEEGHDGGYLIRQVLPTGQPALAVLQNRDLRRRIHQASVARAGAAPADNGPVAVEIALLRAERAALLGFPHHAALTVADQTAGSVEAIDELLSAVVEPAMANAERERAALQEAADADGVQLAAHDWAYYSEKVAAGRFDLDASRLRPYFELDRVLSDGVFRAANLLYGITFELRPELAGYHPDVRVWEVREADGRPLGLYLGDYFARTGKRGGAWMNSFVEQSELLGTRPVVVNNLNVPAPPAGSPALLTLDEVDTLFHEFGHALHGLFSDVRYPRLSGTSVPRDFVEFPSQVNEMWALDADVLPHYAVSVDDGTPLPADLTAAISAGETWGQGFATVEYLAATLLDQAWHRLPAGAQVDDPAEFERRALQDAGVASELIPPRYRTNYFQHVFAGGYSAGYYGYLWAEVLDADTVEWFRERGGASRANGDEFRRKLLAVGGSRDAMASFADVRGRAADVGPLLRRRGLDG
jgi:peptidyl-dipeptidase Dcp